MGRLMQRNAWIRLANARTRAQECKVRENFHVPRASEEVMKLAISKAPPSPPRTRRTWWLAAGGLAVACSALVGWHVGGRARGGAGEAHATLAKIVHGGA